MDDLPRAQNGTLQTDNFVNYLVNQFTLGVALTVNK